MEQNIPLPELRAPWARVCCALLLLMVAWCLLTPNPPQSLDELQDQTLRGDLIIHLSVFSMVSFFILSLCSPAQRANGVKGAISFAIITELLQLFVPNRTCDPYDMIANLMGIAIGFMMVLVWDQLLRRYGRDYLRKRCRSGLLNARDTYVRLRTSGPTSD
ncbi:VanZ like family protein [Polystyrenella longa]|uniref:VanZ like family protein n=1 Tax=Polystyrenella longa TaxID=2528007 RepID=A0A518CGW7_9PLAN|nr:VanZ family protein [Polystyrenella longa]QDU78469.1 VanZ like family protein [Polystyrenella longa]